MNLRYGFNVGSLSYFQYMFFLLLVILPISNIFSLHKYVYALIALSNLFYLVTHKILIKKCICYIMLSNFIWLIYNFLYFKMTGLVRIGEFFILCSIFCIICTCRIELRDLKFALETVFYLLLSYMFFWVVSGMQINLFSAYYNNPNFLASILLNVAAVLLFFYVNYNFFLLNKFKILFASGILLVCLFFTTSRASVLSLLVLLGTYKMLKNFRIVRCFSKLILPSLLLFALVFTYIYSSFQYTEFGQILNAYSIDTLGKSVFSGRQVLWSNLKEIIENSIFIGYGLRSNPGDFFNTSLSSHNLFLQTMLQSGSIGCILLASLLISLPAVASNNEKRWMLISYLSAIIIHEIFEVTITQNNFSTGLSVWLIIGLIANRKISMIYENKN